MIRRTLAAAAVLAGGLTLTDTGTAHAAETDTRPCITRAEYRQIDRGDTLARVARVVDSRGVRTWAIAGRQQRWNRKCGEFAGFAAFDYRRRDGEWHVTRRQWP
jgi:hypothetical protein